MCTQQSRDVIKYSHTRLTLANNYPFSPSQVRRLPLERSFEARRAPWEEQSSGHPTFSRPYAFPCSFARLSACEVRGSPVSYGSLDCITPFEAEQVMNGNAKSQIIYHVITLCSPTHTRISSFEMPHSLIDRIEVVVTANCALML